jgi:hypothetical protein
LLCICGFAAGYSDFESPRKTEVFGNGVSNNSIDPGRNEKVGIHGHLPLHVLHLINNAGSDKKTNVHFLQGLEQSIELSFFLFLQVGNVVRCLND